MELLQSSDSLLQKWYLKSNNSHFNAFERNSIINNMSYLFIVCSLFYPNIISPFSVCSMKAT